MSPCLQPCEVLREAFREQNVLLKLSCWFWAVFFFFWACPASFVCVCFKCLAPERVVGTINSALSPFPFSLAEGMPFLSLPSAQCPVEGRCLHRAVARKL